MNFLITQTTHDNAVDTKNVQWDGSFEYHRDLFEFMGKKIMSILRLKYFLTGPKDTTLPIEHLGVASIILLYM